MIDDLLLAFAVTHPRILSSNTFSGCSLKQAIEILPRHMNDFIKL